MKKHPIDDIFRNKLKDLARQPSANAWDRLSQEKERGQRRMLGWVGYAAASMAVAFIAGSLLWLNQSPEVKPELVGQQIPTVIQEDSAQPEIVEKAVAELADMGSQKKVIKKKEYSSGKKNIHAVDTSDEQVLPDANTSVVVVEEKLKESEPPIITAEVVGPIQVASVEPQPVPTVNRTIIVRVDEQIINEDKVKSRRFTRILRQLKNAKQGESVDWEDVGLNPKALIARVDDRIKNGEEKVSEKYQNIKERTKL
jgi:hypothetical protein